MFWWWPRLWRPRQRFQIDGRKSSIAFVKVFGPPQTLMHPELEAKWGHGPTQLRDLGQALLDLECSFAFQRFQQDYRRAFNAFGKVFDCSGGVLGWWSGMFSRWPRLWRPRQRFQIDGRKSSKKMILIKNPMFVYKNIDIARFGKLQQ